MICAARPDSMPTRNDLRWFPQGSRQARGSTAPPRTRGRDPRPQRRTSAIQPFQRRRSRLRRGRDEPGKGARAPARCGALARPLSTRTPHDRRAGAFGPTAESKAHAGRRRFCKARPQWIRATRARPQAGERGAQARGGEVVLPRGRSCRERGRRVARGARQRGACGRRADADAQGQGPATLRPAHDRSLRRTQRGFRRGRRGGRGQSPGALAHHVAAERAALRELSPGAAGACATRGLVVPVLRRTRARTPRSRRVPCRVAGQHASRRRNRPARLPGARARQSALASGSSARASASTPAASTSSRTRACT